MLLPREPALLAERSQGWQSEGSTERVEAWKAEANVRRRGVSIPEAGLGVAARGSTSRRIRATFNPVGKLTGVE